MAASLGHLDQLRRRWLTRRLALTGRRARLHYRRIFILPSRAGLVFTLMLFGIWLGAVNYNNNMAFLLCFLLIGLGVSAKIHTFRNLLGLEVEMDNAPAVFAGGEAIFPLRLHNGERRQRVGLEVIHPSDDIQAVDVPAGGEATASLAVAAPRRGRLKAGEFRIRSRYPTGLVTAWSWLSLEAEALVYPAPEAGEVPLPVSAGATHGGQRTVDGDDDFHSLRRYQPGDSLRQVAWHTVARGQELQTKRFAGIAGGILWLRWADTDGLAAEHRLSRLCRWILDAEEAGIRYGLELPGLHLKPDHGRTHRNRCLSALALFQP